MASYFKISIHRIRNCLHVKLFGDFDGNSAWELFNLLEKNSTSFHRIIIQTGGLNTIYPFGVDTFGQILRSLKKDQAQLLFTGEKAAQILSEKDWCLYAAHTSRQSRMAIA